MIRFGFDSEKQAWGSVDVDGKTIALGEDHFKPYDLTMGALCGCYSATVWSLAQEHHVPLHPFDIEIDYQKRVEVPTTLQWVKLDIHMDQTSDALTKIMIQSAYDCSMMATLAKVASIHITLNGSTIVSLDNENGK